jgi:branched-chain amino acid transport system permease protein
MNEKKNGGAMVGYFAIGILLLLPFFLRNNLYVLQVMIMCFIWGSVVAPWDLIFGYAGIVSFGQIAFFTIGAFGSAIFSMKLGLSPWLAMPMGGLLSAATGVLIGLPCLKLQGLYVAIVTFALHMTLPALITAGENFGTGGANSLTGIPPLELVGVNFSVINRVPAAYLALGIFFLSVIVVYKVIRSNIGLAFMALRDSDTFAKCMGVNDYKFKLIVFGLSAFLSGMAGAFYAHYFGLISKRLLGLDNFVLLLVILITGGLGRFPGVVISAFIFTFLNEFLRPLEAFRPLIFGTITVLIIILMPEGITEIWDLIKTSYSRRFQLQGKRVSSNLEKTTGKK